MKFKSTMQPAEYSYWYAKTKVKKSSYPAIIAIKELTESEAKVPNLKVAISLGISAVGAGQVCTALETAGIIHNVSVHPLRKDWRLTALGSDLYAFIASRAA